MIIFRGLIYILQSEHYDNARFLRFAYTHPKWWSLEDRQSVVWTAKARLIAFISGFMYVAGIVFGFVNFGVYGIFLGILLTGAVPLTIAGAALVLLPIDIFLKERRIRKARDIVRSSGVTVIGITGSYGKTSAKEILSAMLEKTYPLLKTLENTNTDIGIADFILGHGDELRTKKVFVVEMGAYTRGDIAAICAMVNPDYSLLTGINESHLERFGSLENTIQGKFELPVSTKVFSVLNFDDENIRGSFSRFRLPEYEGVSLADAKNLSPKERFSGLSFQWNGVCFETKLLAEHNATLIMACATIALRLGVSLETIRDAVANLKPVPHRLQPMYNASTDIMVIDDSYNGNPDGVESGLKVLGRAKGRRVVLTPGLVELGDRSESVHRHIGSSYAQRTDLVLLIQSPMTRYIIEGMRGHGFSRYKVYGSTSEAHADLRNILCKGDTILFQNDLTDNYF